MLLYLRITLFVSMGQSTCNFLDMMRESCPFSNFCTIISLKAFNTTDGNMPCCYDCFCDEHCSMFGDCCPDYEPSMPKPDVAVLDCKPAHIASERTLRELTSKGFVISLEKQDRYRLIDSCPPGYFDDLNVIKRCNGNFQQPPNLEDLVLVSDKIGRIFRNKYCAVCNSVFNATKWSLKVVKCVEDISKVQLTLSEAQFFIINYCVVTSERPRDIHVTPRLMKCPPSLNCDNTTNELVDACFNGPIMPYLSVSRSFVFYKNVFCYEMCAGPRRVDTCPHYDTLQTRFTLKSYQMLLDLTMAKKPSNPTKTGCSEAELVDKYTGKYRRVYCPPFEAVSYGKCVPLSQSFTNLLVNVQVFYTLADSSLNVTITSHIKYNETMKNYFLRKIYKAFGFPNCKIIEVFLDAQFDRIFRRFERLILTMTYEINDECTMKNLGNHVKQTTFPEKETWLLQNQFLEMIGKYTFFEDPPLNLDETYHRGLLLMVDASIIRLASIQRFFLCPYFKYSFEEYLDHVTRSGNVSEEYKLKEMSPSSRYLDGFYPITQNEIVACVDVDQGGSSTNVVHINNAWIILIVLVNFVI